MSTKKAFLIIQTGHAGDELVAKYGDYNVWFQNVMKLVGEFEVKVIHVIDEEPLPSPDEIENSFAGVIITGSPAYVTDKEKWSVTTGSLLKILSKRRNIYILGVCYGHQLLADALGGQVADNPKGLSFGTMKISLEQNRCRSDPLFSVFCGETEIYGHVSHRQVVMSLPTGSQVLGTNAMDQNHIIRFVHIQNNISC